MTRATVARHSGTEKAPTPAGLRSGREAPDKTRLGSATLWRLVIPWLIAGSGLEGIAHGAVGELADLQGGGREALVLGPAVRPVRTWISTPVRATTGGHGYRYAWTVGPLNPDHDDQYAYRLPYADDVSYPVLQSYGSKLSHRGAEFYTLDFHMPEGTPVHAARDGIVALVEESNEAGCWVDGCGRLANYIVILHRDGTTGEYFHLKKDGAVVEPGTEVSAGDWIAISGNTGYTTTPHLHFGVYGAQRSGATQSIGVRFRTRSGVMRELRPGARYMNTAPD